jgi:hypothetical protein
MSFISKIHRKPAFSVSFKNSKQAERGKSRYNCIIDLPCNNSGIINQSSVSISQYCAPQQVIAIGLVLSFYPQAEPFQAFIMLQVGQWGQSI